jgi:hypothetical protein
LLRATAQPVLNVTIILFLLLASAILGLATGGFFRVWALLLVSPLIAILAAIVLRSYDFGFAASVPVIVGCLVVSQIAYMAMTFHLYREKLSVQDETDGAPSEHGEQNVRDQNE